MDQDDDPLELIGREIAEREMRIAAQMAGVLSLLQSGRDTIEVERRMLIDMDALTALRYQRLAIQLASISDQ